MWFFAELFWTPVLTAQMEATRAVLRWWVAAFQVAPVRDVTVPVAMLAIEPVLETIAAVDDDEVPLYAQWIEYLRERDGERASV